MITSLRNWIIQHDTILTHQFYKAYFNSPQTIIFFRLTKPTLNPKLLFASNLQGLHLNSPYFRFS